MRRGVRLPLEQLEPYLLKVPSEAQVLDFRDLFGNAHPVELEVGFGKGLFLVTAGPSRPDANFLGIEVEKKYCLFTANRIAKRKLTNVRLVCGDARSFLPGFISDQSFQAVHVYFPDPWWKNRHRKRRLFTAEFARECQRVLKTGGVLHLVTDVKQRFEEMTTILNRLENLVKTSEEESNSQANDLESLTNFERKYRQEGRPIYRADFERAI